MTRQYDCFKKIYADILYRWDLLTKRAEILKFVDEVPVPHRGLGKQRLMLYMSTPLPPCTHSYAFA